MSRPSAPACRVRLLFFWISALALLAGCSPIPPATPVPPPQVPATATGAQLTASPKEIALGRADLPAGFQLAAERGKGPEYLALYLRPAALKPEESGGNTLLGVLTSVGVYTSTVAAAEVYDAAKGKFAGTGTGNTAGDAEALLSKGATDVFAESFGGAAQGADAAEAFRVSYKLQDRTIYEYGHRMRIGNTLAYVVVSALGSPAEPSDLLEDARNLVQRQIDRIAAASVPAAGSE